MNVLFLWMLLLVVDDNVPIVTFLSTEATCLKVMAEARAEAVKEKMNFHATCKQIRYVHDKGTGL